MSNTRNSLKALDENAQKAPPTTPGTKMRHLQAEVDRKDAENEELKKRLAELENVSSLLESLKLDAAPDKEEDNKKKNKKIPVAPAKTAYKYYCEKKGKEGNLQKEWKNESESVRQHYTALAQADKARFESEKASYEKEQQALAGFREKKKVDVALELIAQQQEASETAELEGGKKKKTKEEGAPKRSVSAYVFFTKEQHSQVKANNPTLKPTEITKLLAEMWNKLEDKTEYERLAEEDRQRYVKEKAAFNELKKNEEEQKKIEKEQALEEEKKAALEWMESQSVATIQVDSNTVSGDAMSVISDLSGINNKEEKAAPKKKKDPNAPKKAKTAYNCFVAHNRESIKSTLGPNATNADVFAEIGKQWKDLSEGDKEKYTLEAAEDKERYESEMKAYQENLGK